MFAVKGYYEDGQIYFSEALPPDITRAKLTIVIEPEETQEARPSIHMDGYRVSRQNAEDDFKKLGLYNFFTTDDDANVDWEEHFGIRK